MNWIFGIDLSERAFLFSLFENSRRWGSTHVLAKLKRQLKIKKHRFDCDIDNYKPINLNTKSVLANCEQNQLIDYHYIANTSVGYKEIAEPFVWLQFTDFAKPEVKHYSTPPQINIKFNFGVCLCEYIWSCYRTIRSRGCDDNWLWSDTNQITYKSQRKVCGVCILGHLWQQ